MCLRANGGHTSIETFVTLDFDLFFISRLNSDPNLDLIKRMFGHKLANDCATELYRSNS